MNIGIFLGEKQPESGGGFGFQESILNAIKESHSDHLIVVFYHGKPQVSHHKHIEYVAIPFSIPRIEKIAYRVRRFISENLLDQSPQKPLTSLERAAVKYNIDLMWFLSPHHEVIRFPYITTVWDLEHRLSPYFPEFSFQGWTWDRREKNYREALPKASMVITGTQVGKQEIQDFYGVPEHRIKILPHPTPTYALEATNVQVSAAFKKKLPQNFFYYPAQFWAHKNHLGIIRAVAGLKQEYQLEAHVVFTGSDQGNLHFVQEQVKKLNLTEQVHFLGFVSRDELVYLYQHATALVYASFCGPENLPPLEAMALKCPVIASNIAGAREQLGKNALLFDPHDDRELIKAMHTLIKDKHIRRQLVERGQQRAVQYTSADFVADVHTFINEFKTYRQTWGELKNYV